MTRKYEQRVEFNWGYHDGASDVHNDRPIKISGKISPLTGKPWRPNRFYLHGYRYGVQDKFSAGLGSLSNERSQGESA